MTISIGYAILKIEKETYRLFLKEIDNVTYLFDLLKDFTIMKRYLLFVMPQYYPRGGIDDLLCSFDTLEEGREFIKECKKLIALDDNYKYGEYAYKDDTGYLTYFDYYHIFDQEEMKKVEE